MRNNLNKLVRQKTEQFLLLLLLLLQLETDLNSLKESNSLKLRSFTAE